MNVRAKFECTSIQDQSGYGYKTVTFQPVLEGSEENKSFAKYTPSGELRLDISQDTPAANAFEEGKEYYLDISPVE